MNPEERAPSAAENQVEAPAMPWWPERALSLFFGNPLLLARYVSAGGVAATVELALFTLYHQYFGWPLLVANSSALAIAIITSFMLQKHWTFRARSEGTRQFRLYILMQCISALFNTGLVYLFAANWNWPPLPAKIVQIGIVFIWNFTFCKCVIFAATASSSLRKL